MGGKPRPKGVPSASSEEARNRMKACRGRDTKPELLLRRELYRRGLRYRVDGRVLKSVRRRADLVFGPARVVVFVDGCFWHGCPQHATWPKANAEFWRDKIETNRRRDRDTEQRLVSDGWHVLRFWEHEDPLLSADVVERVVSARRLRPSR